MDTQPKILVVEDDSTIRTVLGMMLTAEGYADVTMAGRGDDGFAALAEGRHDLVLLDVMLPGLDGLAFARKVRSQVELSSVRILMLTARTEPDDIVRGLDAGADDYVTKPFDRKVLVARIKALLRRGAAAVSGVDFDGLVLDESNRSATLEGRPLDVTAGEFALLVRLVAHRGRILTRRADERTVDVQIAKLRQKLGSWADRIETVRGIGYRIRS